MADKFCSPKLRLARAKEHLVELETRIKTFFCTEPYPFIIESNPDEIFKLQFTKTLPKFDAIAADVIDNLRSALDQVWYAIGLVSAAVKRGQKAYFPFADNRTKFDAHISGGCKKFPNKIISFVRTLQPYKDGNSLLWALNRECNRNKHDVLCLVWPTIVGRFVHHPEITTPMIVSAPRWDNRKNEIIIQITGEKTRAEYNIKLAFHEAFYEAGITLNEPALTVLHNLAGIVERILMGLEAETRRLGYI